MRKPLLLLSLLTACATDADVGVHDDELTAPPELEVEAGHHVVTTGHAFGFQIYECRSDAAGKLSWGLRAPSALLFGEDDSLVAVHFGGIDVGLPAGPYWQSTRDGSRVHGGNPVSVPNPGQIPLLRLQALDTSGPGVLGDVTFIQRLATAGGVGPSGACRRAGARAYVPYTAEYVFWAASLARPAVPETIAVPEGHEVAYVGHATGDQVYECAPDAAGNPTWRLRAPEATLTDGDGELAAHFGGVDVGLPAGPYWESTRDGSRVHGGNAISSPNPGSIALLRLQGVDTAGAGIFSRVSFIQRLATTGGVGPSGPCVPLDARERVPYTADYYFFVPRQ